MDDEQLVTRWQKVGAAVFQEMAVWRQAHPHATFAEIEAAVEDRLGALRAELIEDTVATSAEAREPSGRSASSAGTAWKPGGPASGGGRGGGIGWCDCG